MPALCEAGAAQADPAGAEGYALRVAEGVLRGNISLDRPPWVCLKSNMLPRAYLGSGLEIIPTLGYFEARLSVLKVKDMRDTT